MNVNNYFSSLYSWMLLPLRTCFTLSFKPVELKSALFWLNCAQWKKMIIKIMVVTNLFCALKMQQSSVEDRKLICTLFQIMVPLHTTCGKDTVCSCLYGRDRQPTVHRQHPAFRPQNSTSPMMVALPHTKKRFCNSLFSKLHIQYKGRCFLWVSFSFWSHLSAL